MESLDYRPRRVRVACAIGAASIFVLFTVIGLALTNATFKPGDKYAMIGLGVVFAAGILLIARPRVRADAEGVTVRNIIGGYRLPWVAVRQVRFDRGQPWLYLELENDDAVAVLAVQAVDKELAVNVVRRLRSLHAQARHTV
jgi:phosphatidylserine synthase